MKKLFKLKKHHKILVVLLVFISIVLFHANRKSEILFLRNYTYNSSFYKGFINDSIKKSNYDLLSNDNILISYTIINNSDEPLNLINISIPLTASEVYYFLDFKLESSDYKYIQKGFIKFSRQGLNLVPPDRLSEVLYPKEKVKLFILVKDYQYYVDDFLHISNDSKDILNDIKLNTKVAVFILKEPIRRFKNEDG